MADLTGKERMLLECVRGDFNNQPYAERIRTADFMDYEAVNELLRERKHAQDAVRRIEGRIAVIVEAIQRRRASGVKVDAPADPMPALRRLFPLIEKALGGFVFTTDKAGEVAADMAALRAACGVKEVGHG